ncbi:MAG: protein kinase [Victivallaceae bacterium]|nr:protein kinase [Victivallaceae bacterium]
MKIYCEKCEFVFEPGPEAGAVAHCPKCGAEIPVPESKTSPGAVIGDFLIERSISKGGMGEVFLARQLSLDRPVALKVLQDKFINDREYVESLFREARAAAKISHPNIVQAYAVGEEDGTVYFAMEYIRGETLKQILKKRERLDFAEAAKIIRDIAGALDAAWREQKLVHQDIKPDNIMLDVNGFAKLADLGLAKTGADREDESGDEVLGTPQYISPEQLTGVPTDVRSDIYSLGATFFQFVTGRFPYVADTGDEIAKMHVEGKLIPPKNFVSDLPDELNAIIVKMMARYPEDRYQDAGTLVKALDVFLRNYRPAVSTVAAVAVPKLNLKAHAPKIRPAAPKMPPKAAAAVKPPVKQVAPPPPMAKPLPATEPTRETVDSQAIPPAVPVTSPPPRPEFAAPAAEETAEVVEPPARRFAIPRKPLIIAGSAVAAVVIIAVTLLVVTYFVARAGRMPQSLKPFGDQVLAWVNRTPDETRPSRPFNDGKRPRPALPPSILPRPGFINEADAIIVRIQKEPAKKAELLLVIDEFLNRYHAPRTAEEQLRMQKLNVFYNRADEELRFAPSRAAARKLHEAGIAERRAAQEAERQRREQAAARAADERKAAEELAARQAAALREDAETARKRDIERTAEMREILSTYYRAVGVGIGDVLAGRGRGKLNEALKEVRAYRPPLGVLTSGEKREAARFAAFAGAVDRETGRLADFVEKVESIDGRKAKFMIELPDEELVTVVAVNPAQVTVRHANGKESALNIDNPRIAKLLLARLIRFTGESETKFFLQMLMSGGKQMEPSLPNGFWRNYWADMKPGVEK